MESKKIARGTLTDSGVYAIRDMVEKLNKRAARLGLEPLAGEPVEVKHVKGAIYGFCSELGARRIAHGYRSFNVHYSKTLESWFFCLELNF